MFFVSLRQCVSKLNDRNFFTLYKSSDVYMSNDKSMESF